MQEKIYGKTVINPDFRASVQERGILTPCLVTTADADGKRIMISGHNRRGTAIDLGMETIPCYEKEYESDDEQLLDLVHSNRGRIKTEAQKTNEVLRLRKTLSAIAKRRQLAGLTGDVSALDSSLGDMSPNTTTNDEIADRLGISPDEAKNRALVHDDDIRDKFFGKLRASGGRDSLVNDARDAWDSIRERQLEGETPVTTAAREIRSLQKAMLARTPGGKAAKVAGPKTRKRRSEKDPLFTEIAPDTDFSSVPVVRNEGVPTWQFGFCTGPEGPSIPALKIGSSRLYVVDMDRLVGLLYQLEREVHAK